MKTLLNAVRARCGEFWWWSLVMFLSLRFGDLINAYVALWLVPRWIDKGELGAVLPLISFATLVGVPVGVFAFAFMKQVNVLATHGEYGKLKTLLAGVFVATGLFAMVATVCVRLAMPLLLERIRVEKGSLGLLVIASGLIGAVSPVFTNVLQALKRFKALGIINIFTAPMRLVVMLVAMPYRALSGYFAGQTASPMMQIGAVLFSLRRELGRGVKAEPFWTRQNTRAFLRYAFFASLFLVFPALATFVETLVVRQRLPETDSAAYYMMTRFAEIGSYLGLSLNVIVFPFLSEARTRGRDARTLLGKSMLATTAFGCVCALAFWAAGGWIFPLLPGGAEYVPYTSKLAILTVVSALGATATCFATGEIAAERTGFLKWWAPLHLAWALVLLAITGYGYFEPILPASANAALRAFDPNRLEVYIALFAAVNALKALCAFISLKRNAENGHAQENIRLAD